MAILNPGHATGNLSRSDFQVENKQSLVDSDPTSSSFASIVSSFTVYVVSMLEFPLILQQW